MDTKQELLDYWRSVNVNESILSAFKEVPRENFVPESLRQQAYEDQPLPTLRQQSISQPTTIIAMLQALEIKEGEKVFEIGAGVGYQAALIATIIGDKGSLVSVEVIPELVQLARRNISNLGLTNTQILEADGSDGHFIKSPYDKAIITAACPAIPQPIIDQLKEGGIVIAPVGDLESQTLVKGVKVSGKLELEFLGSFRFVPMKGKLGFKEAEIFYKG
jgi:protein-L-isoaspartate(D-aspartate) O-methyltransferase